MKTEIADYKKRITEKNINRLLIEFLSILSFGVFALLLSL